MNEFEISEDKVIDLGDSDDYEVIDYDDLMVCNWDVDTFSIGMDDY